MPTPIGWDPTAFNQSTPGGFTLGALYEYNGRWFRFFQVGGGTPLTNGDVCEFASTSTYLACQSLDAASRGRHPCGVAVGGGALNNYVFLLVLGLHTAVKDAANACTAGQKMRVHAATAGNAQNVAGFADDCFGKCMQNGAAGVTVVQVACLGT